MSARRRHAFTLVELLVVLGVIFVLVALLFPSLRRARRQATVLATPVAFIGADHQLHLTDPSGQLSVPLTGGGGSSCTVCHAPPSWSPSGESILFQMTESNQVFTAVLNPMAGSPTKVTAKGNLLGWLDGERYAEGYGATVYVRRAGTGAVERTLQPANTILFLSPAPPTAPAPLVGTVTIGAGHQAVMFLNKDLSPRKTVMTTNGMNGQVLQAPRVDPMGEYVAWTLTSGGARAALKGVRELSHQPPTVVGEEFRHVYFCDWTDGGELLCNISSDGVNYQLALFARDGQLLRKIETDPPPKKGIVAAWRKYGHQ